MNLDCTWMDPLKKAGTTSVSIIRRMSMETYMVRIYTGPLSPDVDFTSVEAEKVTTAHEVLKVAVKKLRLPGDPNGYELAEVFCSSGQVCKERRLDGSENPVRIQLLWPKHSYDSGIGLISENRFYIRTKNLENVARTSSWIDYSDPNPVDNFLTAFLKQPTSNKEYPDLCNLPDLNERTLLENIKSRFLNSNIYTYVGSILIAVNPFKFFPIYNPKYVKMYQNKRLGDLPPHIFAIADAAFHTMLRNKKNQCIVISGESGSGKTESTNLLLHHLTALSHKGLHGSGVEQTILGAGPVLEAFGNAKTVHNNNSSRFGKFIQVNYKENGMVHGAIVEKYLLEKSRIVSQAKNERNYHVFYYLLQGASDVERQKLFLGKAEDYFYLNQSDCYSLEDTDEGEEYRRLKQSMEMVGFSQVTQARIVGVLSAVLHLGNVAFRKKADQYHDESVTVLNRDTIQKISHLLKVKEKILVEALTQKRATAGGETVYMNYKMEDAVATRDAMAKCLYGALFDWIVLKVNQALLAKRHNSEHQGNSIGVLDIFGFEDFSRNSFEQFCINYANEHLQYYFNQHIFKFEQEEYKKEGIQWKNIEFIDNTGCLELFSKRGTGLFALLDEECNFPGASNDTLLSKFHHHHSKGNVYYEAPQKKELAFSILHYAGKVKYQIKDFREKNSDQIRTDIVGNLKSSSLSFVRELMGVDPVAVLRWTIIKTLIKSMFAFIKAGRTYKKRGGPDSAVLAKRKQSQQDHLGIPDVLGRDSFLNPRTPSPTSRRSPHSPLHENRYSRHLTEIHGNADDDDEVFLRRHSGQLKSPLDPYLSEDEMKVMKRATIVLMKNKSFKPRSRPQTMFSDIKTLKAIANRTMFGGAKSGSRMQPPSVGAQFQWSLSRLMETLNKANPFFIRCIKSNAEKAPCIFDDVLVLRQLRYTGMLATVRIRQSGYNYRLTFEEFSQVYKILLSLGLASTKEDIQTFLEGMPMNQENFQIGLSKVFLRENEKLSLDEALHCAIMKRVICIQRYVKTKIERAKFLVLRDNTCILQRYIRSYLARQRLVRFVRSVRLIQRWYRGARVKKKYCLTRQSAIRIQSNVKGHMQRKRFLALRHELERQRQEKEERLRQEEELEKTRTQSEDIQSSASDEGVLVKESSADELEIYESSKERRDSEGSSGILDDSGSDTLSDNKSRGDSVSTPPPTPTTGPHISIQSYRGPEDEQLPKQRQRVADIVQNLRKENRQYQDEGDSRSPDGTIYIRRGSGRRRPPKISTAPLAKQESFSDMESPPTEKSLPLSPEQLQKIEDTLKPHNQKGADIASPFKRALMKGQNILVVQETLRETKSYPSADYYGSLRRKFSSPTLNLLRRTKSSIKILRDKSAGGKKKKDSTAEESDDEGEGMGHYPSGDKRPPHYEPRAGRARRPSLPPKPKRPWEYEPHFNTERRPSLPPKSKHPLEYEPHSRRARRPSLPSLPKRLLELGVHVLPSLSGEPMSPKSPDASLLSGDEEDRHRKTKDKKRQHSKKHPDKENQPLEPQGNWTVKKKIQWQYPDDWKIEDVIELQLLDEFINLKINELCRDMKKETLFDKVFQRCLRSFHTELKSTLSVQLQAQKEGTCNIKYRDLFTNFELTMTAICTEENVDESFPVTMVTNSFRAYLDEFRNSVKSKKKEKEKEKKRRKKTNKKLKRDKDVIEHQGHMLIQTQFSIPTFCELCSNIMWIMEKGLVCQVCRYTCHKRCISKSVDPCRGAQLTAQRITGTKVFGVPLASLVSQNDKVPKFLENLIMSIELHGLYTEGIYRKCGATNKIKKLKDALDLGKTDLTIEEYPIHVLTTALKCFFRELPEPLLTFELYDEFLQASEIKDEKETVQVLYSIIERLPKVNHDVFERLIFHLARVAQHEASNKMSVNGLAIIFAPCLLRTSKKVQAQEMLTQVSRQTICIDKILEEQLNKLKATLQDINTLESAEITANDRLSEVRASIRLNKGVSPRKPNTTTSVPEEDDLEEQERYLDSHLQSLKKEKDDLTSNLPVLEYRHSSDDEMLSIDDMDSTGTNETADEMEDGQEELGTMNDSMAKAPYELKPVPKRRASVPHKRSPKVVRHKSEDNDTCDSKDSAETCATTAHNCDKSNNSVTKEQNPTDTHDPDPHSRSAAALTSRSNAKDTPEQKQQTESKGPLHGISFKSKSSLGKTDYPSRGELSLRSSFNSKKQNVSMEGSSKEESRPKDSTPNSSPKLTKPLKFTPSSFEPTSAKRYSSYDSTKFNVPSTENSDEDEIMV